MTLLLCMSPRQVFQEHELGGRKRGNAEEMGQGSETGGGWGAASRYIKQDERANHNGVHLSFLFTIHSVLQLRHDGARASAGARPSGGPSRRGPIHSAGAPLQGSTRPLNRGPRQQPRTRTRPCLAWRSVDNAGEPIHCPVPWLRHRRPSPRTCPARLRRRGPGQGLSSAEAQCLPRPVPTSCMSSMMEASTLNASFSLGIQHSPTSGVVISGIV